MKNNNQIGTLIFVFGLLLWVAPEIFLGIVLSVFALSAICYLIFRNKEITPTEDKNYYNP
ncbi:MAG: hypothetical protein WCO58_00975 [bacterium]